MPQPPARPAKEQQLLRHARRESRLIMLVWALALVWSVSAGYVLGYPAQGPHDLRLILGIPVRNPDDIRLVFGMPDWVFWAVVLPWGLALLFSAWFCFVFMADDDLGHDPDEARHG
jgi:hypothetical protein